MFQHKMFWYIYIIIIIFLFKVLKLLNIFYFITMETYQYSSPRERDGQLKGEENCDLFE